VLCLDAFACFASSHVCWLYVGWLRLSNQFQFQFWKFSPSFRSGHLWKFFIYRRNWFLGFQSCNFVFMSGLFEVVKQQKFLEMKKVCLGKINNIVFLECKPPSVGRTMSTHHLNVSWCLKCKQNCKKMQLLFDPLKINLFGNGCKVMTILWACCSRWILNG